MHETKIDLHSKTYLNDKKILNYCQENLKDKRCGCVIIPEKVLLYSKTSLTPIYCWYSPCLQQDTFLTTLISEEKKYCNITLCEISLDEVQIKDGILRVENDCSQLINPSVSVMQKVGDTRYSNIPNMFLKSSTNIIFISIILLVLLYYQR